MPVFEIIGHVKFGHVEFGNVRFCLFLIKYITSIVICYSLEI